MDLRELSNFVHIVELGSLSRAAEALRVAQPALGLQVRNLEAELNRALLLRHSRGVEPTEAGLLLVEHAKRIMALIGDAKRAIAELDEPVGRISLGMTASANTILLASLFDRVATTFPKVSLNVVEALSGSLLKMLLAGELDLACVYSQKPAKGVVLEPIIEDEWAFVSAPGAGPTASEVAFAEMANYPLILPSGVSGMRMRLEQVARERKVSLNVVLEVQSEPLMKELIEKGVAHTVLPFFSVRNNVAQGRLAATRIVDPIFPSTMFIAYRDRTPLSRAGSAVKSLLTEIAQARSSHKNDSDE